MRGCGLSLLLEAACWFYSGTFRCRGGSLWLLLLAQPLFYLACCCFALLFIALARDMCTGLSLVAYLYQTSRPAMRRSTPSRNTRARGADSSRSDSSARCVRRSCTSVMPMTTKTKPSRNKASARSPSAR